MTGPLVVVGDTLLDRDLVGRVDRLCPDAPVPVVDEPVQHSRPGGAGLAALLAAADGREVVLITALAGDEPAAELRELLASAGVRVVDLGLAGATPEKVRVRADGRSLLRLDRGGPAGEPGDLTAEAQEALSSAGAVLVADYGRGVARGPRLRAALIALTGTAAPAAAGNAAARAARDAGDAGDAGDADAGDPGRAGAALAAAGLPGSRAGHRVPVVWDPHPRGPEPVAGVTLVTPNGAEAQHFAPGHSGAPLSATTARARDLQQRWAATAVSVTMGGRGALVVEGDGPPSVVPAPSVACPDPCGAGDRFASAAAGLLADGALPSEAVAGAVIAASAFVAAGGASSVRVGAAPPSATTTARTAADVAARVRSAGGTIVATGGCFDLLHAGHVAVLQQARALGDCLVVLLNSDDSVRRLKGPSRPLQGEADRADLLRALACVDAVLIFDEDTPSQALEALRPDVFAKGGDYALTAIPEADVVAGWGGQAVVLPYLAGRSTTRLIQEAVTRA